MNTPSPPLRLARMHYPVTALGPGRRLGIWTQGCPLACTGCMSRDTWDAAAGTPAAASDLARAWRRAYAHGATGITISGGEPLTQPRALAALLDRLPPAHPDHPYDLLLYTGYDTGELAAMTETDPDVAACLARVDAVITGRYEADRPTGLIWRGSANQDLLTLTDLGRSRYRPYLEHTPAAPPVQIGADEHGLWLIGVPPRGHLARLTRALRRRGIALEGVSWRPPSTDAG